MRSTNGIPNNHQTFDADAEKEAEKRRLKELKFGRKPKKDIIFTFTKHSSQNLEFNDEATSRGISCTIVPHFNTGKLTAKGILTDF